MQQLRITLRRSLIGSTALQRACVATLGLRRVGQWVVRPDNARTAGLLRKVRHLVEAVPIVPEGAHAAAASAGTSEGTGVAPEVPAAPVRADGRKSARGLRARPNATASKTRTRKARG